MQGDLGTSIRTNRPVMLEVTKAVRNTLRLAALATVIGFVLGTLFGFVAGYFRDSWIDSSPPLSRSWACRCRTTGSAWCW